MLAAYSMNNIGFLLGSINERTCHWLLHIRGYIASDFVSHNGFCSDLTVLLNLWTKECVKECQQAPV